MIYFLIEKPLNEVTRLQCKDDAEAIEHLKKAWKKNPQKNYILRNIHDEIIEHTLQKGYSNV